MKDSEMWLKILDGFQEQKQNDIEKMATELKKIYDGFRRAGFTDKQSMTLLVSLISEGMRGFNK